MNAIEVRKPLVRKLKEEIAKSGVATSGVAKSGVAKIGNVVKESKPSSTIKVSHDVDILSMLTQLFMKTSVDVSNESQMSVANNKTVTSTLAKIENIIKSSPNGSDANVKNVDSKVKSTFAKIENLINTGSSGSSPNVNAATISKVAPSSTKVSNAITASKPLVVDTKTNVAIAPVHKPIVVATKNVVIDAVSKPLVVDTKKTVVFAPVATVKKTKVTTPKPSVSNLSQQFVTNIVALLTEAINSGAIDA
jgi:hypothetical protein